jgi:2-polyprenyl-3-methyl-5-hydroxy-6-metoxy-1,4-benzoquinol methylase
VADRAYTTELRDYYNHPASPVHLIPIAEKARQVDREFAQPNHWRRELALAIRRTLRGRRVLEIACGTGIWTRLTLEVASSVLATDASPRILARAKKLVRHGKEAAGARLDFLQLDAFELGHAPGRFDAALAINWFQHVPCARCAEFLQLLHQKLGPNAVVFFATTHRSKAWRARLFRRPGEADFYSRRTRPDGSRYEVIDNLYSVKELARIFAPYSKRLRFRSGQAYSWITYQAKTGRR